MKRLNSPSISFPGSKCGMGWSFSCSLFEWSPTLVKISSGADPNGWIEPG